MSRDYKKITEMLLNNEKYSFELRRLDGQYGVNFIRSVAIWEPNPREGEVANPESGLDQQFSEGSRRKKRGFYFNAKTSKQALNLLELTCKGVGGLKSTTKEGAHSYSLRSKTKPAIHGFSRPRGGLDKWIFANFDLEIRQNEGNLIAKMGTYEFSMGTELIYSQQVRTVEEAIQIYDENPVNISTLNKLRLGLILNEKIKKNPHSKEAQHDFLKKNESRVSHELIQIYDSHLQELNPFNISQVQKNAIFLATMLENCYSK